jgi:hypothetical protein
MFFRTQHHSPPCPWKKIKGSWSLPLFFVLLSLGACSQAVAGGDSLGDKIKALKRENRSLEAELGLASKGRSYVLMDLRTESNSVPARITLKNRGMVLREFEVERINYRKAKQFFAEPVSLTKRTAFFDMKRKEIKPPDPEDEGDTTAPLEFLELKDVPSKYALSFGGRLLISVEGQPKGLFSGFAYRLLAGFTHLRFSLTLLWNHVWKNKFAVMELMMAKEEAQALYWSLEEGMNILIVEGSLNDAQPDTEESPFMFM